MPFNAVNYTGLERAGERDDVQPTDVQRDTATGLYFY